MNSSKYGTAIHDAGHADFGGGDSFYSAAVTSIN
jgi:hypothetical protein